MAPTTMRTDELLEAGEQDLGASDWLRIDQTRIDLFADATEDHQWIHVDPERAKNGPFGTTIAHGYLTLALVPRLLDDVLRITDQARGANYKLERVRFTAPVPSGSEVRLGARLVSARTRGDGGVQFNLGIAIEVKGQSRPALVGEVIYLAYPDTPVDRPVPPSGDGNEGTSKP